MKNNPLMAEVISFPNRLNSAPPESISEKDGVFMKEDRNGLSGWFQNGEPDLTKSGKRGNDFIESEKKDNPFDSFLKKDEVKPKESKKEAPPGEQSSSFMDSFLIELVHGIKNGLASVYHATVLTMDRYDDVEIRKRSHTQVKEEIKKIDSVLNTLLNFINVNTPIIKASTLYVILEEILEASDKQLRQKNIKIYKKYENDLPDTFIHPEQVRFILHSALQYAILSTPQDEVIGFLMKSSDPNNGTGAEKPSPENNRRYVEVMIGFDEDGKPGNKSENLSETPSDQNKGMADLILRLAKDILERNHGMMIESRKRSETILALRFPVERRKVVYYEPIAL
jgi:nitrogen-specific signal transduction histidine kinase